MLTASANWISFFCSFLFFFFFFFFFFWKIKFSKDHRIKGKRCAVKVDIFYCYSTVCTFTNIVFRQICDGICVSGKQAEYLNILPFEDQCFHHIETIIDWFLYDGNVGRERVNISNNTRSVWQYNLTLILAMDSSKLSTKYLFKIRNKCWRLI